MNEQDSLVHRSSPKLNGKVDPSPTEPFQDESGCDYLAHGASPQNKTTTPLNDPHMGPFPWLEKPFQNTVDGEDLNKEATALSMDCAAKGTLHVSNSFLGPAMIQLATLQAIQFYCRDHNYVADGGCSADSQWSAEEQEKLHIYGLKPSSILTISNTFAIAISAAILPFVGAVLDRSKHRKTAGRITAYLIVFINLSQILLTQRTWPFFWFSHCISEILFQIHNIIILAYMQNLTPNPTSLSSYTMSFAIIQFACMTIYMITMIIFSARQEGGIVFVSRIAHIISGCFGFVFLGYCWQHLFGDRPAVHQGPDEWNLTAYSSIFLSSVAGLQSTGGRIKRHFPALKWLLITLLFSPNVGSGSYFSIFSTIQKSLLQMNATQIGYATLIALLSTFIGARLSGYVCRRFNPLVSFRICLCLFTAATLVTALFVKGPEQIQLYYFIAAVEGVSLGWLMPTERVLFCTMAMLGEEAEIMGVIMCVHSAAAWLPPFLFSVVNESGYNLRVALASEVVLLSVAIFTSFGIGTYGEAIRQARDPSKLNAI